MCQLFCKVPPEITAQCSDKGIVFSVVRLPKAQSLWEVGIDHEPLTAELASQRGYILYEENQRTTLEIPVFSVGYTYEVRLKGHSHDTVHEPECLKTSEDLKTLSGAAMKPHSLALIHCMNLHLNGVIFTSMMLAVRIFQDINLSSFYGTFQLLLRDSKTLEMQTSTSKRCLFKTQDMIGKLCS